MNEIERNMEYPALNEKRLTRTDIIKGNINMLDSGARECRRIGELASAEEKEIIADILRAELSRQENAPLTCDGCRREDFQWVDECIGCVRQSHHEDRYEPKGEKE